MALGKPWVKAFTVCCGFLNDTVVGFRGVAQLVEHRSPKPGATGSIPVTPASAGLCKCVQSDCRFCWFYLVL